MPSDIEMIRRAVKAEKEKREKAAKAKLEQRKRTARKDPDLAAAKAAQAARWKEQIAKAVERPKPKGETTKRAPVHQPETFILFKFDPQNPGQRVLVTPGGEPDTVGRPSAEVERFSREVQLRDRTLEGQRLELNLEGPQQQAKKRNRSRTPTEYERSFVDKKYYVEAKLQRDREKWIFENRWKFEPQYPRNPYMIPRSRIYDEGSEEWPLEKRGWI